MQFTRSQIWLLGAFITTLLTLANTFFLTGQVQTYVYIVIAVCFAFFAIMMSSNRQKNKLDA